MYSDAKPSLRISGLLGNVGWCSPPNKLSKKGESEEAMDWPNFCSRHLRTHNMVWLSSDVTTLCVFEEILLQKAISRRRFWSCSSKIAFIEQWSYSWGFRYIELYPLSGLHRLCGTSLILCWWVLESNTGYWINSSWSSNLQAVCFYLTSRPAQNWASLWLVEPWYGYAPGKMATDLSGGRLLAAKKSFRPDAWALRSLKREYQWPYTFTPIHIAGGIM